jgi:hypothetical protein
VGTVYQTVYYIDFQPVVVASSDADAVGFTGNETVSSFTASIDDALDGSWEVLSAISVASCNVAYNSVRHQIYSTTQTGRLSDCIAVLRTVSYLNTSPSATVGDRAISVRVSVGTTVLAGTSWIDVL